MTVLGLAAILAGVWFLFRARERNAPVASGGGEERTSAEGEELLTAPRPEEVLPQGAVAEQSPDENAGAEETDDPSGEIFRGRVLDVATGEPLGYARVVAGELEAEVDADGFFSTSGPLEPDTEHIEFYNDVHGSHIRTIDRTALEATSEGCLARIAIGPTYRLDIWRVSRAELDDWRARLVEIRLDGQEVHGDFIRLYPADPPFLRYDNPWKPNAPESRFRVDVRNALGTRMGSSDPLDSAVGIFPGIVSVQIDREFARVSGRVVDELGHPVKSATVSALNSEAQDAGIGEWPESETDDEGRFELAGLVPGLYEIFVHPRRGEPPASRRLYLPPGLVPLDDFVVAFQEGAGMITGHLVSGNRTLEGNPLVRLRAVDGRSLMIFDRTSPFEPGKTSYLTLRGLEFSSVEAPMLFFEFNEVPAGEYELSVVSDDGLAWTPAAIRASPPAEDLVFVREDDVSFFGLALELWDAETDAPIDEFWVQLQRGSLWNREPRLARSGSSFAEIPEGAHFRFSVHAEGYEPSYGGDENFAGEGSLRTATLELDPGWGARFLMRDLGQGLDHDDPGGRAAVLERPGVADVEVWADGERVALSDEQGIALVSLPHEPDQLVFLSPFWRMVGSDHLQRGRLTGDARDAVVWFVRE